MTNPVVTAVSVPSCVMVATLVLLVVQAIGLPDKTFPLASFAWAVNCAVLPAFTVDAVALKVTEATGTIFGSVEPPEQAMTKAMIALPRRCLLSLIRFRLVE